MKQSHKEKWYIDDTIVLLLVFLLLFILYSTGVAVFISKADDKTVGAFEAITGISGLILSFGTVFYVVKAYKAQTEQIKLQKEQIDTNKRETEFNRALDIVYRQLEHTKYKLTLKDDEFISMSNVNFTWNDFFSNFRTYATIVHLTDYENQFYSTLLSISNFSEEEKKYFFKIYTSNIKYEFKILLSRAVKMPRLNPEIESVFRKYLFDRYSVKMLFQGEIEYDVLETEEERMKYVFKKYDKEIGSEIKNFDMYAQASHNIYTLFQKYDVWINE